VRACSQSVQSCGRKTIQLLSLYARTILLRSEMEQNADFFQRWRRGPARRWRTRRNWGFRGCWAQRRSTRDPWRSVGWNIEAPGTISQPPIYAIELSTNCLFYQEGDPKPKVVQATTTATYSGTSTGMGIGLYAVILLGGAVALGAYKYMQSQEGKA